MLDATDDSRCLFATQVAKMPWDFMVLSRHGH